MDTDSDSDGTLFLTQNRFIDVEDIQGNETVNDARKHLPEMFDEEVIQQKIKNAVPSNTKYKNAWAVSSLRKWQNNRLLLSIADNLTVPRNCLIKPILDMEYVLNRALQCFIFEVRKEDGTKYKSKSLYGMICGIQSYLRLMGKSINIFEDEIFKETINALDAAMKQLSAIGYGPASRQQSEPITFDEEEMMWEKGVLGDSNLRDTLLYLNGLQFALRGGQEHRTLRRYPKPQITGPFTDGSTGRRYLLYREDVSKANSGGLKHKKAERKIVKGFDNPDNQDRCHVRLWEKYKSLCPTTNKSDAFYLSSLKNVKDDCWYMDSPVGINTIKAAVKMCNKAGIPGRKTNHSLRVTAATRLYDAKIDEQQICEQTGHRSSAVRCYKRTNSAMQANVSDVLYGKKSKETVKGDKTVKGAGETSKGDGETSKGDGETSAEVAEIVAYGDNKRSFSFSFNFSLQAF